MFKKKKSISTAEGFDTLLGIYSTFEGNLESEGSIRIDGKIIGNIKTAGDVFIGEEAVIKGDIQANNAHIAGTVEGNLNLASILRLLSTAKLLGDIQVHGFVADEGAIFHGKCHMINSPEMGIPAGKHTSKRSHTARDYKKSSALSPVFDEQDKAENSED